MTDPEIVEKEPSSEQAAEKAPEIKEEQLIHGAEILENPPNGSFQQGLLAFIAWVKTLLDK